MDRRATIEEVSRIDVRFMHKRQFLLPGVSGSLSWNSNGIPTGSVSFRCLYNHLILSYRFRSCGTDWQKVKQSVYIEHTHCNYGGTRPWFSCPRCQYKCAVLHEVKGYFVCRKCSGLHYYSQQKGGIDRLIDQRNKLGDKIFDETGHRRKKWMHRKTFGKLFDEFCLLDERIDKKLLQVLGGYN